MAPFKSPSKLFRGLRPRAYLVRACKVQSAAKIDKNTGPPSFVMVPEPQITAMSQALVDSTKALKEAHSKSSADRELMLSLKAQLDDALQENDDSEDDSEDDEDNHIISAFDDMSE